LNLINQCLDNYYQIKTKMLQYRTVIWSSPVWGTKHGPLAEALFSSADLAPAESLYSTVAYCCISFVFGKNCPNID
jgi:hypothetical protein